jgi:hypothetical protein
MEKIFDAVGRGNEAESLVGEALDGPGRVRHGASFSLRSLRGAAAELQLRSIALRLTEQEGPIIDHDLLAPAQACGPFPPFRLRYRPDSHCRAST